MQKSKRGRALFDKLSNDGSEISGFFQRESRWSKGRSRESDQKSDSPFRLVSPRDRFDDGETWYCFDEGRLNLAFTARSGAVALFALIVLCSIAFLSGHWRGKSAGFAAGFTVGKSSLENGSLSEIEQALQQPPASELVESLTPQSPSHRQPADVQTSSHKGVHWVRGHHYILVQEFQENRAVDAEKAQAFLADHGVETAVVGLPNGHSKLITLAGFDWSRNAEKENSNKLLQNVRNLGKKYYDSGGGYRLEGYFVKLTGNAW